MGRLRLSPIVLAAVLVPAFLLPAPASAQLVLGQYEEEAPVRSWNTFALAAAAALGRGETVLTLGSDASCAAANPALLAGLPAFTLAVNGYVQSAAFDKFGPVNTGVFVSAGNVGLALAGLDFAGASFRLAGWTFALNVFTSELYGRPAVSVQDVYNSVLYGETSFSQSGLLRTWQIAVARRLGSRISLGIALNVLDGGLERELIDKSYGPTTIITDRKKQTFSGFSVTGGTLVRLSEKLHAAVVFRMPFRKRIRSTGDLRYEAPAGGTDITIADAADDRADLPAVVGLGCRWSVLPDLDIVGEASASFWSGYRVTFFGDPQVRGFTDAVKAGLGIEYRAGMNLFGSTAVVPLRIGGVFDSQPIRSPWSAYAGITVGTGVQWKWAGIDVGGLISRESGSGAGLAVNKFALTLRFVL